MHFDLARRKEWCRHRMGLQRRGAGLKHRPAGSAERSHWNCGFTLIELLVVVTIMLIMTGLVVGLYTTTMNNDRIRSAARQMQSAMMGAHDRAIHAHQPRGLRLVLDVNDPTTVTSVMYIQPVPRQSYGYHTGGTHPITFERFPGPAPNNGPITIIRAAAAQIANFDWQQLYQLGAIYDGTRVRIPAHTGLWYTIASTSSLATSPDALYLTAPLKLTTGSQTGTVAYNSASSNLCSMEIELGSQLVPNSQPIQLPSGIAIDLNNSKIPASWVVAAGPIYSTHMDIMFSPQGNVIGHVAAQGLIHFLLAEIRDITNPITRNPAVSVGEKLAVTLVPQTGQVTTSPVNTTDIYTNTTLPPNPGPPAGPSDGLADDPFYYARAGAVAGR